MPRAPVTCLSAVLLATLVLAPGCAATISQVEIEAAQTAARVKTALVNDAIIGTRVIDVRVRDGVVRLSGRVATQDEATRAIEIARSVPGVSQVDSQLRIGGDPSPEDDAPPPDPDRGPAIEFEELEPQPTRLALGAAMGFSNQRGREAGARVSLSPLVRLGAPDGLGPAIAFDWFDVVPLAPPGATGDIGRARVRPIMVGVGYGLPIGRLAIVPSVVAGYSFNTLSVPEAGAVDQLSVGISNSFAWRPGVQFWIESSRRTALLLSIGRVYTSPRFTVVDAGQLRERSLSVDTTVLLVGLAYKVF